MNVINVHGEKVKIKDHVDRIYVPDMLGLGVVTFETPLKYEGDQRKVVMNTEAICTPFHMNCPPNIASLNFVQICVIHK